MAGTSVRNLISQDATLLVTSFVEGHYEKPKNLPEGSSLAHSIMEKVTGQKMKPILPFQHINYDMTSTYVWDGDVRSDAGQNQWAIKINVDQRRGNEIQWHFCEVV